MRGKTFNRFQCESQLSQSPGQIAESVRGAGCQQTSVSSSYEQFLAGEDSQCQCRIPGGLRRISSAQRELGEVSIGQSLERCVLVGSEVTSRLLEVGSRLIEVLLAHRRK